MSEERPGGGERRGRRGGGIAAVLGALLTARALRDALRRRRLARAARRPQAPAPGRRVPAKRRAETLVAVLLLAAGLFAIGFTVAYASAGSNTQLLGIAVGGALALLAAALIIACKADVPPENNVR